jgi:A/G-specific adenine glycosylase
MVAASKAEFRRTVWAYFEVSGRHELPWRLPDSGGRFDPYAIMVSELMLQQTQVIRVIPKYLAFLRQFPTVQSLAQTELSAVLIAWSGLGYNRRAKYLWQAAQTIVNTFDGVFPPTVAELVTLPGIGKNTAGAIVAYAFNQPVVFIETNVRTVYIHHFFNHQTAVSDAAISQLVTQTLDTDNPRQWYWALMDYGSHLKKTVGNANKQSQSYVKQSAFHGSRRQIRGQVLRQLAGTRATFEALQFVVNDDRLLAILDDLLNEGLVKLDRGSYYL